MRISRPARRWLLTLAALFLVVYSLLPMDRARADRALVVAAVLLVLWGVRAAVGNGHRPVPQPRNRGAPAGPPDAHVVRLARLESAVSYGADSREQYERSLLPLLRKLVEDRLALRHGVALETEPARCRDLMGEDLWAEVVTPAQRSPVQAPGVPPKRVDELLDRIEGI